MFAMDAMLFELVTNDDMWSTVGGWWPAACGIKTQDCLDGHVLVKIGPFCFRPDVVQSNQNWV